MFFLKFASHIKHALIFLLILTAMLGGYFFVGKEHHFVDFGMSSNISTPLFFKWLLFISLIQVCLTISFKKEDISIYQYSFNKKNIFIITLSFFGLLFLERAFSYQFWEPMRIDFEQHMWVAIGRNLNDFLIGKRETFDQYSIWAGQYNSFYGYFIAVLNFIVSIDSWDSYRGLSIAVMGVSATIMSFILNRLFGKVAVIFFISCVLFSAYMNFASFYMKHHIVMLFFYSLIMFLVFNYWKKNSFLHLLFLSISCVVAFIAYIGCIYYLPIGVMAVLLTSNRASKKVLPLLIVSIPTLSLLAYLLLFPEKWPSSYFVNKGVWHHPATLTMLWRNILAQLQFMLIPSGIWGWLIQACFMVGVGYIIKSRQKETWIWLIGLMLGFTAMLTSWDREMGHNFIMILPYLAIASFGASQLWRIHFSFSPYTKMIYKILFVVGFCGDLYAFTLSERWLNYAVFDLAKPINGRVWFFDDARKLEKFSDQFIVIDSSLVNNSNLGIVREDTALSAKFGYALHFSDFLIYKKAIFLNKHDAFPQVCQGVLLTDKTRDEVQILLGKDAVPELIEKYRPANPRYEFLQYQSEVFHAIYKFKFIKKCK